MASIRMQGYVYGEDVLKKLPEKYSKAGASVIAADNKMVAVHPDFPALVFNTKTEEWENIR